MAVISSMRAYLKSLLRSLASPTHTPEKVIPAPSKLANQGKNAQNGVHQSKFHVQLADQTLLLLGLGIKTRTRD